MGVRGEVSIEPCKQGRRRHGGSLSVSQRVEIRTRAAFSSQEIVVQTGPYLRQKPFVIDDRAFLTLAECVVYIGDGVLRDCHCNDRIAFLIHRPQRPLQTVLVRNAHVEEMCFSAISDFGSCPCGWFPMNMFPKKTSVEHKKD